MSLPRLAPWTAVACLAGLAVPGLAQAPAGNFTEAVAKAAAAREGRPEEALRWYQEAVRLRPSWDEGWWWIGALSYERGDHEESARAFSRFVELKPDAGPGWALLGLSEFERGRYDAALDHLTRGLSLGTVGNAEVRDAVYYHVALLRIRAAQFELAVEPLSVLARAKPDSPRLVTACGLVLLRRPYLPADVPAESATSSGRRARPPARPSPSRTRRARGSRISCGGTPRRRTSTTATAPTCCAGTRRTRRPRSPSSRRRSRSTRRPSTPGWRSPTSSSGTASTPAPSPTPSRP